MTQFGRQNERATERASERCVGEPTVPAGRQPLTLWSSAADNRLVEQSSGQPLTLWSNAAGNRLVERRNGKPL